MTARIIDGAAVALRLQDGIAKATRDLVASGGPVPGLAVILVGDDPASDVYVRRKTRLTQVVGMRSIEHRLPADTSMDRLMRLIDALNEDASVHGILVQFPLPAHLDSALVVEAIAPVKDVDGFNPVNVGRVASGLPGALVPCTPLGVMRLIHEVHGDLAGMDALVVGASNIVGRPMARLLLQERCTVSIAHIRTTCLARRCREADILVVATGVAGLIRSDCIKPGATVIDVGITRRRGSDGRERLIGDVAFEEASQVAGWITPVPGGVGPMTIACLLENTLRAAGGTPA